MLNKDYKIGQYKLLSKVGFGSFGDVWKAEKRTALDVNYFALKFFRPKDDQIDFDKIGKELAVWKRLKGLPHIISVIELDRFDDYVYVVSDFADGGSLEKWLKDKGGKASSQAEAIKIILEILTGLENLHDKGFIHRDLKPDNILIMNGKFCLADFGVSREIKTHSKATGMAGTMKFMPPEAFAKTPSITPQTDIWAIGVIFQKLLTGELPYPQEDEPSLISAILMREPDDMPETVPEDLREIVKKALQKKPEDRFQTAREMNEALTNPEQFLAKQILKVKNSKTIDDKDFDNPTDQSSNLLKWIVDGVIVIVFLIFGIFGITDYNNDDKPATDTSNRPTDIANPLTNAADSKTARDFFDIAYDCVGKSNYNCAIENYTKAIEIKPDYVYAYNNRGIAYKNKGNYDQAIRDYTKAIELMPDYATAYENRGSAFYNKENYDQAIKDYTKVIELKPDYPDAYYYRGRAYYNKGNFAQAIEDYTKEIELKPNYAYAYNNRGVAYRKKGNYDQAIKDYTKAIEVKPDYADAYNNRGVAYNNKGNYDQAIRDYTKAIGLKPDYVDAYNNRGIAYNNKGNYDQAIADYRKAIQIDPNSKVVKDNLEKTLRRKNSQ